MISMLIAKNKTFKIALKERGRFYRIYRIYT